MRRNADPDHNFGSAKPVTKHGCAERYSSGKAYDFVPIQNKTPNEHFRFDGRLVDSKLQG